MERSTTPISDTTTELHTHAHNNNNNNNNNNNKIIVMLFQKNYYFSFFLSVQVTSKRFSWMQVL